MLLLLPYDLFDAILAFCDFREFKNLTLVSRHIQAAADQHFWRLATINASPQTEGYMNLLCGRASQVRKLTIKERCTEDKHEETSKALLGLIEGMRQHLHITDLNLNLVSHSQECYFDDVLESLGSVEQPSLLRSLAVRLGVSDRSGKIWGSILQAHPNLTSLEIPLVRIAEPTPLSALPLPALRRLSVRSPNELYIFQHIPVAHLSIFYCDPGHFRSLKLLLAIEGLADTLIELSMAFKLLHSPVHLVYCASINLPHLEILKLEAINGGYLNQEEADELLSTFTSAVESNSLVHLRELHLRGFHMTTDHLGFVRRCFDIWPDSLQRVWIENGTQGVARLQAIIDRAEAEKLGFVAQRAPLHTGVQ
ncbi:hypothetical protein DL93DRAFT_2084675 [Clavulina sp. PMI_390]|nr:hypothetical protein DL93DRAFT_2084675 [Clavulina sp. PMI_390]